MLVDCAPFQAPVRVRDRFRRSVIAWGRRNARAFYWRQTALQPLHVLLLEVLLVKTRAEVAEPVALRLIDRYPLAENLAAASVRELEALLQPLGLFRKRARALKALAGELVGRLGGQVPDDERKLRTLPYVGRYTANATLCFAFGERRAIVDANVVRLLSRYFKLPLPETKIEADDRYWTLAASLLPRKNVPQFNWYLLDLGALVCKPIAPRCDTCPLARTCATCRTSHVT